MSETGATQHGNFPTVEAHLTLGVLAKLGLFIVATVILIAAIGRAQQLIGLVLLAGVLSATVSPLIERLRVVTSLTIAALLVHVIVFLTIVGTTALVVQRISAEAEHLEVYAAQQLAQLDDDVAPIAFSRADLSRRAADATASWGTTAVLGDDETRGIAMRASQLVVITVLSIFFTLQGDRIIDAVVTKTKNRHKRRVIRVLWSEGVAAGATQLRHTLLNGTIAGAATTAAALAFGLPGVALLGFWAACVSAVPYVGPLVAWVPVVVVGALILDTTGIIVLFAIAGMAIVVLGRARAATAPQFGVGPLVMTLGIAAGVNAAGLPGAAAGLAIATGVAHATARHRLPLDDVIEGRSSAKHRDAVAVAPVEVDTAPRLPEAKGTSNDALANPLASEMVPAVTRPAGVFVDLSSETLLRIAGLVVLAVTIQLSIARTATILIWSVVGLLIAVGLDRPVSWVHRRTGVRRSAIVIGGGLTLLLLLAVLAASSRGGVSTVGTIDEDLSQFATAVEEFPLVGSRLAELDLDRSINDLRRRAPDVLNRSPVAGQTARIVGGGVVAIFWIVATAVNALIDGRRVTGAIGRRVPARYIRQVSRLAEAARSALAGYVAGSALVASINAVLVAGVAALAGVPIPAVFAVWAFSWNFVPQIGAILGWAPVLLLAIVVNPVAGVACVAFFVVYQVVENNLIQPTIVGHAVDISALAALGAALTGAAIAGLVGGVLAIPVVGVVHALRTELASEDFPRLRDRRLEATASDTL